MTEMELLNHIRRQQEELESIVIFQLDDILSKIVPNTPFNKRKDIIKNLKLAISDLTYGDNNLFFLRSYKSYEEFFGILGKMVDEKKNNIDRVGFLKEDINRSKKELGIK